jgi:UDP-glucuronate 4-epimerase
MDFIEALENKLGKKAEKNLLPIQAGDVPSTYANVEDLIADLNYKPETTIEEGINNFVNWYIDFFDVDSSEI